MADASTLLQHRVAVKIPETGIDGSREQRRRKSREAYSSLHCLASLSSNPTYSPTSRTYRHSPVTSGASSTSSRRSYVIALPSLRLPSNTFHPTKLSKIDQLVRNLSSTSYPTAKDGYELAAALATEAPVETSYLLLPAIRLCNAGSVEERSAGYELIKSLYLNQRAFTAVEGGRLWSSLSQIGLESDPSARAAQMDALSAWLDGSKGLWGLCGVVNQVLKWTSDVTQAGSVDVKTFDRLDGFIRKIIEAHRALTESQMAELLRISCVAVDHVTGSRPIAPTQSVYPTPASTPSDVSGPQGEIFLSVDLQQDIGQKLLNLLTSIRKHDVIPEESIPGVIAALCQLLEQHISALEASVIQTIRQFFTDDIYGYQVMEALEKLWAPAEGKGDPRAALGALRVAKEFIIETLSETIGFNSPMGEPSKSSYDTTIQIDWMMRAMKSLPEVWMGRSGGDILLVELVDLVEQIMTQFRYDRTSTISSFVGCVLKRLMRVLVLYRHDQGHTYKLSILEHNAAPSSVIAALERLLRAAQAQDDIIMQPPLNATLLSVAEHLTDKCLYELIIRLQKSGQMEPNGAAWKWEKNLRILLNLFATVSEEYPQAWRAFMEHLSYFYKENSLVRTFHSIIAIDIITTLEKTLPDETDEIVIKSAFDICLKELVLSYEEEFIPDRIRALWMRLALEDNPTSFRRVLAVKFLILGFNRFAFRPPQSLKVMDERGDWKQSGSAAKTAISLYHDIVALAGLDRDDDGRVQGPRLQCTEARLVVLQWLLRLRAGATHRIFAVDGPLTEVIPLAALAHRAKGEEESVKVPLEKEFKLDPALAERRKRRAETRQSSNPASTRSRNGSAAPGPLSGLNTLSSIGPEPASPVSYTGALPRITLWNLPDRVRADLFVGTAAPSPAMITFQTNKQSGHWLRVSIYVYTIVDILENDDDWEIVSYILCHLPLQLANKHFFCGPKVDQAIRQITTAVCNAIKDNRLYKNVTTAGPINIPQENVQALLYHTLMVLIAYRNRFNLVAGVSDPQSKAITSDIIESFAMGLRGGLTASKLSIEGLSMIVYAMPDDLTKFATFIVEGLARTMTNPDMAIHIIEFLLILGFSRKTYLGTFRAIDYQTVFGVALMYIEQHYRSDKATLQTTDGKTSFSLAQHVLRTAFLVIHTWFMRMKPEERARYIPFISEKLVAAHKDKTALSPMTISSLDSLARYSYGNVDPKVTPSFLYKSIICPDAPESWQNLRKTWRERQLYEMNNVADIQAWKLGPSIITVSIMKQPKGWLRLTSRRPSCYVDMICHLEGDSSSPYALVKQMDDKRIEASAMPQNMDVDENFVEALVEGLFSNSKDIDKPDPISGLSWTVGNDSPPQVASHSINPALLAPLLTAYPNDPSRRLRKFPDYNKLKGILEMIDIYPVIDTHKVGVVYVAPGQSDQLDILSNCHGSPAYAHFIKQIGRLVKIQDELEVYTGGLQAGKHGDYALAWWDDIGQILFHVSTFMPNIDTPGMSNTFWKQQEIGNIAVKIIWNESGKPFNRETFTGQFNKFNIIIEPHTLTPEAAYQENFHIHGFFKVLLQADPSMPQITPIGEFKLVAVDDLPRTVRNFALIACLFCTSWTDTGEDGPISIPLNTNWQQRLKEIERSERLLPDNAEVDYSLYGLPTFDPSVI